MDWFDIDLINRLHYAVIERCGRRVWQRLQRRLDTWRQARQDAAESRMTHRRARMNATQEALIEQALARTVLDRASVELREVLLAELWERHHKELLERALEVVRQEQQEAEEARRERWQAQKAQERRALEKEADQLIEQGIEQGLAEERQEFEERRQRLISQREAWKARATAAEAWMVEHIQTLLPEGRRVLLRDAEIPQLRLQTLNAILEPQGLRVRAKLTETARHVTTEVEPQRWEQRTRFWLTRISPAGVIDEEDEAADLVPQDQPQA